jgi:hypothetical protein
MKAVAQTVLFTLRKTFRRCQGFYGSESGSLLANAN